MWRRRNGLVSCQPHLLGSPAESGPDPLLELDFVFIKPLSLLAFRIPRKPQPGLLIGQGHPWGEG